MSHLPVLLPQVLTVFQGLPISLFFDGTLGAGGHAEAILSAHPEIQQYIASDRDPSALQIAKERLASFTHQLRLIHGSYADVGASLQHLDGCLIDIGVSSMQLDRPERGFSFLRDGPLDMRMDPEAPVSARTIINRWPEKELADLFYQYGQERRSRFLAKAIVEARRKNPIETTRELALLIERQVGGRGKIHPATRVFQALRIAVNDELGQLERGLKNAINALRIGGRIAVITFHSLEDRIAKQIIKGDLRLRPLSKKPQEASLEEVRKNPRSRSAKLRSAERVE
jgi:16S rRNA (cytosine1402-N4)-methyltransferase